MSLVAAFAAFQAELPATLTFSGPDDSDKHGAPPRLSWEPTTGSYGPPRGLSGGPGDEGMLAVRELSVRVRLWGADLAATETLLVDFVNVVDRLVTRTNYSLGSETWRTGGVDSLGVEVELVLVLKLRLDRTLKPTRVIEQINATFKLNQTAV